MIEIIPNLVRPPACPSCESSETEASRVYMPGMFWLADFKCNNCSRHFITTLPVGHTIDVQLIIDKSTDEIHIKGEPNTGAEDWLPTFFDTFYSNVDKKQVEIEKVKFSKHQHVVILNTLDSIYGHVLLKLFNAQYHLDKDSDIGLIIIAPRSFQWLIPKGIAEVWLVDLTLKELSYSYPAIEKFVQQECARFDHIFVSNAYSHPDFFNLRISRFTGIEPFDLDNFDRQKPCFTFALREDRLWFENGLSEALYWIGMKFRLNKLNRKIFVWRQNVLVGKCIRRIRKHMPDAKFYITGLGVAANEFNNYVNDKRCKTIDEEIERTWCEIYAESHVIIGVHGSNMLLPTSLAAACVEILPSSRFRNIVQDISVRYPDRRQLFMYRFTDQFSSPGCVAEKAVAIVENYNSFNRSMTLNVYGRSF